MTGRIGAEGEWSPGVKVFHDVKSACKICVAHRPDSDTSATSADVAQIRTDVDADEGVGRLGSAERADSGSSAGGGEQKVMVQRRRLLVDVVLALIIAAMALTSAQLAQVAQTMQGSGDFGMGRDGRRGPGPWWGTGHSFDVRPPSWFLIGCLVVLFVGVALRRRRPRIGYLLTVAATIGYLASGHPFGPVMLAPALGLLGVATRYPVRQWLTWAALLVPVVWAGFVREPTAGLTDPDLYQALLFGCGLMILPALIGLIARNRDETQRRTRDLELRRSAFEERLRIAREVHDVVGHSLSVINMQAGVALHLLDRRPEQAATSLQAIRSTSKNALDELRSTLEVFRDADYRSEHGVDFDSERVPVAGLSRLTDLIDAFRAGGREVELQVESDHRDLPAAVDLAAYRIIQEALTNVARHTGDASARVSVRPQDDRLRVEVIDDGAPSAEHSTRASGNGSLTSSGSTNSGNGSGIAGMTERARGVGGTLSAGPVPGGYQVLAWLPLTPARSADAAAS